ncbi:Regulator of nonsense transcripts UPF2 [Grifola frondosa]|uniref:Regulator of nonsense transcripts UPF2 n=1 Tax=Grifola frondosa TaxID=5627 RepID=A0A1C7LR89_GRIFR|nr:Regulator of nonsense transcripts UPF2 [Grifola frondosa]
MEVIPNGSAPPKVDEEHARRQKRAGLKELNSKLAGQDSSKALDSSLKRHTALIKRIRQSLGTENRDQLLKDIDALSLEKYVDEIAGAVVEGIARCKTEKDVWSAVEVRATLSIISAMHRRFPKSFTPALISSLSMTLTPPSRATLSAMSPEQREKEDTVRVSRQRPVLRVCSELALVGIIKDAPDRSGGDWIMKVVRDLLSNDPTLSSLPLLSTFLKSYSRPYLGIVPPASNKQISATSEPGTLSAATEESTHASADSTCPPLLKEEDELVEKDIRDRFKRMCEGYFENVAKKLVIEHDRLQEQDRRNHEAYIRSGEIFEDRQQAYEKMTKSYEKLLASCQTLSELLYLPLPALKTASQKSESILIGTNTGSSILGADIDETTGGKWEDEEERRFFEDIPDLKDYVPRSVLGLSGEEVEGEEEDAAEKEKLEKEKVEEEVRKLEEELAGLKLDEEGRLQKAAGVLDEGAAPGARNIQDGADNREDDTDDAPTPTPGSPKMSPPTTPQLAPQGPSQLLTALLARLPDATNRTLVDQAAVDFAFLNSKAARRRLVKFMSQVPKNRTDLLPHYSRLIATLNKYMPDIGTELVAVLDEEFRYLQRKKNVVKELSEVRLRNITFLSNLTKFRVIPPHVILHMFKVCLDDFSGTNIENIALLLEGCGRFLLRSDDTREPFGKMVELMRRKQSMQHFDQRQLLLLENAYYQCNPPERAARQEKERTPMELFIHHLIYDVLTKKTIDKVLKLLRKLDWDDDTVMRTLYKVFTKPWKLKYGNIPLLAMLTYDLQRYHAAFSIAVVDQVLEDIRRGLEHNIYSLNQRRLATIKYLGELYIYRLVSSGMIFDMLWTLVTFGHPEGRPFPNQPCTIDMPDDFFRIRLVCVLLDTCGMCFDRGSQQKKLDAFLTFFQAVRPRLVMFKTLDEAALAVDELFSYAYQNAGITAGDDSGEDSGEEDERPGEEEEEEDEQTQLESPVDERAPSPEAVVLKSAQENTGPSEDDDAEFAKELAKMVTDTSSESRKVDKKTALALWDSTLPPSVMRKKRNEEAEEDTDATSANGSADHEVMNFTLFTKRGTKQQTRQIAIPAESALAVQTRTAQMQDKVEQQHLKRLVLNYEQREEAEELKGETFQRSIRAGANAKRRLLASTSRSPQGIRCMCPPREWCTEPPPPAPPLLLDDDYFLARFNGAAFCWQEAGGGPGNELSCSWVHSIHPMQDSDDYFDDAEDLDASFIAVLDQEEAKFIESQRLTQQATLSAQLNPSLPSAPPAKRQKVNHVWNTATSTSFDDFEDLPEISIRNDGTYGLDGSQLPLRSNWNIPRREDRIIDPPRRSTTKPLSTVRTTVPTTGVVHQSVQARRSSTPVANPPQHSALRRTGSNPPLRPSSSIRSSQSVTRPHVQQVAHVPGQGQSERSVRLELDTLRTELAELSRMQKETEKALKEAQDARFAKEGEVRILRKGIEKKAQDHAAEIARIKSAKEAAEAMQVQMQEKMKEEMDRLKTQYAFKQHELETSMRKASLSAHSKKIHNIEPTSPISVPSPIRQWNTLGRDDGPSALMRTPTRPRRRVAVDDNSPDRPQKKKQVVVESAKSASKLPGFHNAFQNTTLQLQSSHLSQSFKGKGKERAGSQFDADIVDAEHHIPQTSQLNFMHHEIPSPPSSPLQMARPTPSLEYIDIPAANDVVMEPGGGIVPGGLLQPADIDMVEEIKHEHDIQSCEVHETLDPPNWANELHRIVFTHRMASYRVMTFQMLMSSVAPASPMGTEEYSSLCATLLENLSTASTMNDDSDAVIHTIEHTLAKMGRILSDASQIPALTALLNLLRVLAASLPSFTSLSLSPLDQRDSFQDMSPEILVMLCDVVRTHLTYPEKDASEEVTSVAKQAVGLLEALCWNIPEELVIHYTTIAKSIDHVVSSPASDLVAASRNARTSSSGVPIADRSLFRYFLSFPDPDASEEQAKDLSAIPHIEQMAFYLVDSSRNGTEGDLLREAILTFIATLSVVHADAIKVLLQSQSLIPAIVLFLTNLTNPIWEEDETLINSASSITSIIETTTRTVSLLYHLVLGGSSRFNLRQKLILVQNRFFHGISHMFTVTMGRLSYADTPEWVGERNQLQLEQMAGGRKYWKAGDEDDEENEARMIHPPDDDEE